MRNAWWGSYVPFALKMIEGILIGTVKCGKLDGVLYFILFLKEGFMNKKIVAISILMLMMCAMAASVFADDSAKQYEYTVSVRLRNNNNASATKTETVYIWASSQSEARTEAEAACDWKFPGWTVISCGYPVATGNSR
jgi:hypothetical protein